MIEIWDAYDKEFNKIENVALVRGEAVPDGMYHLVCEIILNIFLLIIIYISVA